MAQLVKPRVVASLHRRRRGLDQVCAVYGFARTGHCSGYSGPQISCTTAKASNAYRGRGTRLSRTGLSFAGRGEKEGVEGVV
jgi:hypothetical protein